MILVLACRHEIGEGEHATLRDANGYLIIFITGQETIKVEDFHTAVCEECGNADVQIVGVR